MLAFKGEDSLSTFLRSRQIQQDCGHPLTGLRPIALRVKDVVVGVIVLCQLVPQHIEGLHTNTMHVGTCDIQSCNWVERAC